ncbi:MAG: DUF2252 domain-containing protein [Reyranella sp.]|uniref:DUF2252 domain-containing protein n=1 Tax=Reyranella sp. TaxID=1929291 RepID=UPI001ACFB8C0|nr:DUF2252 domain-containing protein [Reyranella sp.]MBN9090292.1 DUF2252 domain-containing protein [Reyranella sp.]
MADIPDPLPPQTHAQPFQTRADLGRALREKCKRGNHAAWEAPADRRDPIDILIEQGEYRLPELLPLRYARMKASPFAFLRGSAAVMAADLAGTPSTGLLVQAAGDCHCLNFGGFATPERRLSFDINDFDETAVAPWEWDLKRLATSFAVATLGEFDKATRRGLAESVGGGYRSMMAEIAAASILETWYRVQSLDDGNAARSIGLDPASVAKADRQLKHRPMLITIEHSDGPAPKLTDKLPDLYHPPANALPEFLAGVEALLEAYRQSLIPERRILIERYRFADAAYKVVGVGSVGTMCGVALMASGDGETLQLQFKEADASVLEAFSKPSPYANHGERVVRGQRLLQAASDILLGFGKGPRGRDFYVRQLRDAKIKPVLDGLSSRGYRRYAWTCGEVLARAHARSADAVVLSGYLGRSETFDQAVGQFAMDYARQTESDHAALLDAIKSGRVPVTPQDS